MLSALLLISLALHPAVDDLESAQAAVEDGRLNDAAQILERLLARTRTNDRAPRLALARVQLDQGFASKALETIQPLPLEDDGDVTKLTGLIFTALGDEIEFAEGPVEDADYFFGEGLSLLEQAAALAPPGDIEAAVEAAYLALYIFGDWSRAEVLADTAVSNAPDAEEDLGEALLIRGCARVRGFADMKRHMTPSLLDANWDVAVSDLLKSIEILGPERSEPWFQLIWMYEERNRPDDAVAAALSHHDAIGRVDPSQLVRLALRYARESQLDASLAALQALVERDREGLLASLSSADDPTADTVALSRAVGPLLDRWKRSEARDLLEVLCDADPEDADLWNNYAFLCRETAGSYRSAGKRFDPAVLYERAYAAYERALAIDDTSPRLLNDTALILQYHLHRDLDRARELYERAVELADEALAGTLDPITAREMRSARTDARSNLSRLGSSRR
jgi:tetratricopeptide (TPR) repeat protein